MPGANHVGIRVADCKFGGEFFPLHLGKKLVDKENYEGNGPDFTKIMEFMAWII